MGFLLSSSFFYLHLSSIFFFLLSSSFFYLFLSSIFFFLLPSSFLLLLLFLLVYLARCDLTTNLFQYTWGVGSISQGELIECYISLLGPFFWGTVRSYCRSLNLK